MSEILGAFLRHEAAIAQMQAWMEQADAALATAPAEAKPPV